MNRVCILNMLAWKTGMGMRRDFRLNICKP